MKRKLLILFCVSFLLLQQLFHKTIRFPVPLRPKMMACPFPVYQLRLRYRYGVHQTNPDGKIQPGGVQLEAIFSIHPTWVATLEHHMETEKQCSN